MYQQSELSPASLRWLPALIVAIAVGSASPVAGQSPGDPNPAAAELKSRLRGGDTVTVSGPAIGRIRGRFLDLTADTVTLATDGGRRTVAMAEVDRVTRRRRGVVLGTLIGLGVGITFAIPLNMLYDGEGGNKVGPITTLLAVSTGIGLGIDAMIDLPRTVYRRPERLKVRLAPHLAPGGGGVAMHVTF